MRKLVLILLITGALGSVAFYSFSLETLYLRPKNLAASTLLSETSFDDNNWSSAKIFDQTTDNSFVLLTMQDPTFGTPAPSRFVRHQFCRGAGDLPSIGIADAHWNPSLSYDPQGQPVSFVSFRFNYWGRGIALYPLIFQDGIYYGGPKLITSQEGWNEYFQEKIIASQFVVRDDFSAPGNPDFSRPMVFGFITANSTNGVGCPPASIFIDNLDIGIDQSAPTGGNFPPTTVPDVLVVETQGDTLGNIVSGYGIQDVLANDYDPEGGNISLTGFVTSASDGTPGFPGGAKVDYTWTKFSKTRDTFLYEVTDGFLSALGRVAVMVDCGCVMECILIDNKHKHKSKNEAIDLAFIRRFRDEQMKTREFGAEWVDLYYNSMTEMLKILMEDRPDIGAEAVEMVELLQPNLRNMLDGDGTTVFTQEQMDAIDQFVTNLSGVASAPLVQRISEELTRLGPLNDYVGVTAANAVAGVFGVPISTGVKYWNGTELPEEIVLEENYPNPFSSTTRVRYNLKRPSFVSITVFDLNGQIVRRLLNENQTAGIQNVEWDGANAAGFDVASGIYFIRLSNGVSEISQKVILSR